MQNVKFTLAIVVTATFLALSFAGCSGEKAKPYPLDTCLVCGMKLGTMSKPYVFVYQGQEIKLCDKSEKEDFDKDRDKYLNKLEDAKAKSEK